MKIVVCVKQIQNPEIASSVFRIDEEAKTVIPVPGLSPVISPIECEFMGGDTAAEMAAALAQRLREADLV